MQVRTSQPAKWTATKQVSRFDSAQKYQEFPYQFLKNDYFPSQRPSKEYLKENFANNSVTSNLCWAA
jgi:hypothetical protein